MPSHAARRHRARAADALRSGRPRRGTPAQTRARLLAAAAVEFNRVGYHGTDSNRLARAAGRAGDVLQALSRQARAVSRRLRRLGEHRVVARRRAGARRRLAAGAGSGIVDAVLEMHRAWRGLRASLRALVAADDEARAFYRGQRRRQLELLAALRRRRSATTAGDDAMLLFTLERVCDAIADGELRDLGVPVDGVVERLRALVAAHIAR
jgi:hypothetical protein